MSTYQTNVKTKELRITPHTNEKVRVCRTCTNNRNGFCRAGNTDAELMYDMPLSKGGCGKGLKYNLTNDQPEQEARKAPEGYGWR